MICKSCGAILPDNVAFCTECGTKVEKDKKNFCSNCGSELEPTQKFCPNCGQSVNQTDEAREAELEKVIQEVAPGSDLKPDVEEKKSTGGGFAKVMSIIISIACIVLVVTNTILFSVMFVPRLRYVLSDFNSITDSIMYIIVFITTSVRFALCAILTIVVLIQGIIGACKKNQTRVIKTTMGYFGVGVSMAVIEALVYRLNGSYYGFNFNHAFTFLYLALFILNDIATSAVLKKKRLPKTIIFRYLSLILSFVFLLVYMNLPVICLECGRSGPPLHIFEYHFSTFSGSVFSEVVEIVYSIGYVVIGIMISSTFMFRIRNLSINDKTIGNASLAKAIVLTIFMGFFVVLYEIAGLGLYMTHYGEDLSSLDPSALANVNYAQIFFIFGICVLTTVFLIFNIVYKAVCKEKQA